MRSRRQLRSGDGRGPFGECGRCDRRATVLERHRSGRKPGRHVNREHHRVPIDGRIYRRVDYRGSGCKSCSFARQHSEDGEEGSNSQDAECYSPHRRSPGILEFATAGYCFQSLESRKTLRFHSPAANNFSDRIVGIATNRPDRLFFASRARAIIHRSALQNTGKAFS